MTTPISPELLRSLRIAADASAMRPPRTSPSTARKKALSPFARRQTQRFLTEHPAEELLKQFVKGMGEAGTGLLDLAGQASHLTNPLAPNPLEGVTRNLNQGMEQLYGSSTTLAGQRANVLGTAVGSAVGPGEIANLVRGGARAAPEAMVALEHYTPHPLEGTAITPTSTLRGPVAGAERARQAAFPDLYAPRSHFQVAGTNVEHGFGHLPVYHGQIPAAKIYDVAKDPLNLLPRAEAEATRRGIAGPAVHSLWEQEIQKAGFTAFRRGNVVASFTPVPVRAGRAGVEHQVAARLAAGEGFTLNPRVEMRPFQGTGYLVADPALTQTGIHGPEDVRTFLARPDVQRALQDPHAYVGGWQNELNISHVVPNRARALELGAARDQQAVGHIVDGVYQGDIPATDVLESPAFRRRAAELGQPQRPVPAADYTGGGNAPVNPAAVAEYRRLMGSAAPAAEHLTAATEPASEHLANAAQIRAFQEAGLLTPEEAAPHIAAREAAAQPLARPASSVNTAPAPLSVDQWLDITGPTRGGPIPGWQTMEQGLKFPPTSEILPTVEPGSVLGNVPQGDLPIAPEPLTAKGFLRHLDPIRAAFDHPAIKEAVQRSVEHGFHLWYANDPIAQSAINVLGKERGMAAFKRFAQFMGPTSRMTAVPWNVRNASYWFTREAQGTMPTAEELLRGTNIPQGYAPRSQKVVNAGLAEMARGLPFDPVASAKIARYAGSAEQPGNILGNWRPFTLDTPGASLVRSLGNLRVTEGHMVRNLYGPIERAAQDRAAELAAEGTLPVPANRDPTAAFQAAIWPQAENYGYRTLNDEFARAVYRTAHHTNTNPMDILSSFWQGKGPLF